MEVNCIFGNKGRIYFVFVLMVLFLSILTIGITNLAEASTEGQTVFQQNCFGCHSIGEGDKVGPDLQGVTQRRDREWLENYVISPADMKTKGDPVALELAANWSIAMPNPGISADAARAVVAYLAAGGEAEPATPVQQELMPEGNAAMGRNLFTGAISLQNSGGACIGCHNAGEIGTLGGGSLGPDLTQVYSSYGEGGLLSVLTATPSPFPTMSPLYAGKPLTQEETAHLIAFLATTSGEQSGSASPKFATLALAGTVVLLALSGIIWRNRLQNVRQSLVEQAKIKQLNI